MPPAHIARQVARLAAILRLDHSTVTEAVTDALAALAANPADSTRDTAAHHGDPRGRLAEVIRASDHESPHSAQQAIRHAAMRRPADGKQPGADQPQLSARRVLS
jgi:hypothetical protein